MYNQLTPSERKFHELVMQEARESMFEQMRREVNARLLQARSSIIKLNEAIVFALKNNEPEDSLYILELSSKIKVLIAQVQELEGIVEMETNKAA